MNERAKVTEDSPSGSAGSLDVIILIVNARRRAPSFCPQTIVHDGNSGYIIVMIFLTGRTAERVPAFDFLSAGSRRSLSKLGCAFELVRYVRESMTSYRTNIFYRTIP